MAQLSLDKVVLFLEPVSFRRISKILPPDEVYTYLFNSYKSAIRKLLHSPPPLAARAVLLLHVCVVDDVDSAPLRFN